MSRKVCILYGLNEGPAMGRQFVKACSQAGYVLTRSPAVADVIFAHSGGCLLVPSENQASLVVIVGPPYWPGRGWLTCTAVKIQREFRLYRWQRKLKQWARKWTYHLWYALNLKAGLRMAAGLSTGKLRNSNQRQFIIRNRHDAYCSPHILNLSFAGPRTFISLPGEHDDCWNNPEPYIHLLQSLMNQETNYGQTGH